MMGARVEPTAGHFAPLTIHGQRLKGISYATPVASAQLKSCVLLAGLLAEGSTIVSEPAASRDHTELMLKEFGAAVHRLLPNTVSVEGLHELRSVTYHVPGDISSAAFLIAAACVVPDTKLRLKDVDLNPTRTAFIDVLQKLGASISTLNVRKQHGELVGDISVSGSRLAVSGTSAVLSGPIIPNIIDEIPILAVVATQVEGRIEVRDAKELRVKESDRIRTVAEGIRALGGKIEELEDGFAISGPQQLRGGRVETAGDHRIAMAFAIAGLIAEGTTEIVDADCASVSFPEFYETLARLSGGDTVLE
jgi:3-phosphoshikimate 1-carboxyvinyltransferase